MPQPVKAQPIQGGEDDGRETAAFPLGDLTVALKKPLAGQMAAIRRIIRLLESPDRAARGQGGTLFLDVADTLVVDPAILQRVYEGMATEAIKLEEYADVLVEALRHFIPEDPEEAGTPAIKGTRQPRARATTSRPRR